MKRDGKPRGTAAALLAGLLCISVQAAAQAGSGINTITGEVEVMSIDYRVREGWEGGAAQLRPRTLLAATPESCSALAQLNPNCRPEGRGGAAGQ